MTNNKFHGTLFDLTGKTCIVTGAAGLLGREHCLALAQANANLVMLDILDDISLEVKKALDNIGVEYMYERCDIRSEDELRAIEHKILTKFGTIDVLINNAALNPKVETNSKSNLIGLEGFDVELWKEEVSVGLTGAILCAKVFGASLSRNDHGVIINISSDLGLISPDQRLYESLSEKGVNYKKPVSYSVIKTGILGLTRYLATYWQGRVRCNALAPGGVFNNQNEIFVKNLISTIPAGRMANIDEYHSAIIFLASEASKYMNGATLVMDGGRTIW